MRRWKWYLIAIASAAALYLGGSTLAHRNYWAGLFWGEYLEWLPAYDIIDGPRQSFENRLQYRVAVKFIQPRLLTPSTASFPSFSECRFGVLAEQRAMVCYVDSQNGFGAIIRARFQAVFMLGGNTKLSYIRWLDEDRTVWMNDQR